MADTKETYEPAADAKVDNTPPTYAEDVAVDNGGLGELPGDRPAGWMYRERKIGSVVVPWYASPMFQLIMVSFVCFTCPGMFNALTGLGGGGRSDDGVLAANMVISSLFFVAPKLVSRVQRRGDGNAGDGGGMRKIT